MPQDQLVKPEAPIKRIATQCHGLTARDVADSPVIADISADVRAALHADALVAHNAHVDVGVLRRQLTGWNVPEVFDTLKLARRPVLDVPGYKLGTLVERFKLAEGFASELRPHRATYDALVTARLFVALAIRFPAGLGR
ncbi:MAG TPA: 3'-5' exonuclease [Trebonia sp.]